MIAGRLGRLEQTLAKAFAPPVVYEVEVFGEDDYGAGRREGGPAVELEIPISFGRSMIVREIMMDLISQGETVQAAESVPAG